MNENSPPKSFNLLTEPWIPIAGVGLVSLNEIFTHEYLRLGGTPVEKVVILRLLLCIVHASSSLPNMKAWVELTPEKLASNARDYLKNWLDRFDLYDETYPFLQFPKQKNHSFNPKKDTDPNSLSLFIASGNKTILTQWNAGKEPTDAELARLILCGSCYGMGGKRYDSQLKVDPNVEKGATGSRGTLTGIKGYLHSYMLGKTLWETLRLNLLTDNERLDFRQKMELGKPFWESMPKGEIDTYNSRYLGTLFPIDKFFIPEEDGGKRKLHMTDGLKYPAFNDPKQSDPGILIYTVKDTKGNDSFKALWCNPERAPWRELQALLQFVCSTKSNNPRPAFVYYGLPKLQKLSEDAFFGLWVGGVAVSDNSGEQFISGQNDYVNSEFLIPMSWKFENAYEKFKKFIEIIDRYADALKNAVNDYFESLYDDRRKQGDVSARLFWEKMNFHAQSIISLSEEKDPEKIKKAKQDWRQIALSCYKDFCPHETPRQMRAYTQNIPDFRPRKDKNDKKKGGKK
ncbi:MAG: type I-E CRISPR-associated protein Cse1/CasA [Thermoguttaceae bacterium]|nr:type I-E CRISPR-associated protein Cse1/CasA [Thermoguttaceae bacterium]